MICRTPASQWATTRVTLLALLLLEEAFTSVHLKGRARRGNEENTELVWNVFVPQQRPSVWKVYGTRYLMIG